MCSIGSPSRPTCRWCSNRPRPARSTIATPARTPFAEALDVINSVLLTKGFTLVRSGRMLVLVNLEDGIPPNLVTDVPLDELDKRGEYEIIRVAFPVLNMTAEEAAEEVKPLLGPQGTVIVLPQAKRIQVTETGGRLRTIRSVINAVERPTDAAGGIREIRAQAPVGRRCDALFAATARHSRRGVQHARRPAAMSAKTSPAGSCWSTARPNASPASRKCCG